MRDDVIRIPRRAVLTGAAALGAAAFVPGRARAQGGAIRLARSPRSPARAARTGRRCAARSNGS